MVNSKTHSLDDFYNIQLIFDRDYEGFLLKVRKTKKGKAIEQAFETPDYIDTSQLTWRGFQGHRISVYNRKSNSHYIAFGIIAPDSLNQKLENLVQACYSILEHQDNSKFK